MKNFFYVSLLALFIAAPLAATAGEHAADHAKVDCTKAENKDHAECKKH